MGSPDTTFYIPLKIPSDGSAGDGPAGGERPYTQPLGTTQGCSEPRFFGFVLTHLRIYTVCKSN